ncbi:MAG: hypothetical protein RLZZ262_32 [Bacteroidota bacterium]
MLSPRCEAIWPHVNIEPAISEMVLQRESHFGTQLLVKHLQTFSLLL